MKASREWTLLVLETVERTFVVKADSIQAARKTFESTPISDLEEDQYEVTQRVLFQVIEGRQV